MKKAKVVGHVQLSQHVIEKKKKAFNNNNGIEKDSVLECANKLRQHGVTVDGKQKIIGNARGLGLHLLGKLDHLKANGFTVA